jgi:hypothetical protein
VSEVKPLYILFACFALIGGIFAMDTWTLDGNGGVYWTNNGYKISAYPATSTEFMNHYHYVNFTSTNPANIMTNLSFVFDSQPLSGDVLLWQNMSHQVKVPYTIRQNQTYIQNGVTGYTTSTSPCLIGDNQNLNKYNVTFSTNNSSGSKILCFDSFTNISNNYTLTYSLNTTAYSTQTQYWMDWGSILNTFTYTAISNHHVYTINNVPFNGNTNYQTKFLYSFPKNSEGKFDIYAHTGSPADVVNGIAQVFVELDPWYSWSTLGYSYWISNDNSTMFANLSFNDSGRTFYVYENGTTAKSNIDNTMLFGDDFDGASVNGSKWNWTGGSNTTSGSILAQTGVASGELGLFSYPSVRFTNGTALYSRLKMTSFHPYVGWSSSGAGWFLFTIASDCSPSCTQYPLYTTSGGGFPYSETAYHFPLNTFFKGRLVRSLNLSQSAYYNSTSNPTEWTLDGTYATPTDISVPMGVALFRHNTGGGIYFGEQWIDWVVVGKYNESVAVSYGTRETGSWTINGETYVYRTQFNVTGANLTDYQVELNISKFTSKNLMIAGDASVIGNLTVNYTIGGTAIGNNSTFTPPANLTINATASAGYYFVNWTTNCNGTFLNALNPNTLIQVNNSTSCYAQANFATIFNNLTLKNPSGGTTFHMLTTIMAYANITDTTAFNATYMWMLNGVNQTGGSITNFQNNTLHNFANRTGPNTPGNWSIAITVLSLNGNATNTSANATVENAAPTLAIALTPATAYSGETFTCTITPTDEDSSTVNITVDWFVDGAYNLSDSKTGHTAGTTWAPTVSVYALGTHPGQNISCNATATDGTTAVSNSTANSTMANTAPVLSGLGILPSPLYNGTAPWCNFTVTEADDYDYAYATVLWYGNFSGGILENATLSHDFTSHGAWSAGVRYNYTGGVASIGESYWCQVNLSDIYGGSAGPTNSSHVNVTSSFIPANLTMNNVTITPNPAIYNQTAYCQVSATSPTYALFNVTYFWYVNFVLASYGTAIDVPNSTLTSVGGLGSGNFSYGDTLLCQAYAHATTASTNRSSSMVYVTGPSNTIPVLPITTLVYNFFQTWGWIFFSILTMAVGYLSVRQISSAFFVASGLMIAVAFTFGGALTFIVAIIYMVSGVITRFSGQ